MPTSKKLIFSVLLVGAGGVGYWIEREMYGWNNVPYLISLVIFLMIGLWSMSAVKKNN